jgi:Predicted metal-dependent hydrolase of the TIM-barrel fold
MTRQIVDTHVHFFDLSEPQLRYEWLNPENRHPVLSPDEIATIATSDYRLANFIAEAGPHGAHKAVHVQAAVGIADQVEETKWLQAAAEAADFPLAIVGSADLRSETLPELLDRHEVASPLFRGIRDFGDGTEYLDDPRWEEGLRELGRRNLVLSLDCTWERMPLARDVAARADETVIVLDHMGFPQSRSADYFDSWHRHLAMLATAENVVCKISEFTMIDHGWDADVVTPWIDACLETFGPDRCVFGTNWPVDKLYASYGDIVAAFETAMQQLSDAERDAVMSGNAERIYRF